MKVLTTQILPDLQAFIAQSVKSQKPQRAFTAKEIVELVRKHWKVECKQPTEFELFPGEVYFYRSIYPREDYEFEVKVPKYFHPKYAVLELTKGGLLIKFQNPNDKSYSPSRFSSDAPKDLNAKGNAFCHEVRGKIGPVVTLPLPKTLSFLTVSELGYSKVGFTDEVNALEERIRQSISSTTVSEGLCIEEDKGEDLGY